MPGIAYMVARTVRGIEGTEKRVGAARLWDRKATELFARHAEVAIAEDGSPSGYEVGLMTAFRDITVLRPTWRDFEGARRLRVLMRAEPEATAEALHAAAATSTAKWDVLAPDLDAIHGLARAAASAADFCAALRTTVIPKRTHPAPIPWRRIARRMGYWHIDSLVESDVQPTPEEATLIEALVQAPGDVAAAGVYADWLERAGRVAEAAALRSR